MQTETDKLYCGIAIPKEASLHLTLENLNLAEEPKSSHVEILASGPHISALRQIFDGLEAKIVNLPSFDDKDGSKLDHESYKRLYDDLYRDVLRKLQI